MSKARIAVVIGTDGDWSAFGGRDVPEPDSVNEAYGNVCEPARLVWVEVDLPSPVGPPIDGNAVDADPEALAEAGRKWDARLKAQTEALAKIQGRRFYGSHGE